MQKIIFDGKKCIRCKNCVAESEFNGVKFSEGKIFLDTNQNEDWDSIIEICPTGAISFVTESINRIKSRSFSCRQHSENNSDE